MTLKNGEKNFFFFKKPNSLKINFQRHACLRKNRQLFLVLTLWRYSKCKDLLDMLNVYKILGKEHKAVDRWAADEISIS